MTCLDVDRIWNEFLDARDDGPPGVEGSIADHASACPRCHSASARYQVLAAAIAALEPPPAPSPELRSRFLAAAAGTTRPRASILRLRRAAWFVPALAASMLAAFWFGSRPEPPRPAPARPRVGIELASTLAGATSATLDLARGVSAPAARIGLDVLELDAGDEPSEVASEEVGTTPSTSDLLRSMGDRIDAGARPLSGRALHAFGFLLPATSEADRPPPPGVDDGR